MSTSISSCSGSELWQDVRDRECFFWIGSPWKMFMVHAATRGHVAVHSPCYSQDHANVGGLLQAVLMPWTMLLSKVHGWCYMLEAVLEFIIHAANEGHGDVHGLHFPARSHVNIHNPWSHQRPCHYLRTVLSPGSRMMPVVCAPAGGHVNIWSQIGVPGPGTVLMSVVLFLLEATWISTVCAAARGHTDVYDPCWSLRSMLQLEALMSLLSMMPPGTYARVHLPWCGHGDRHDPWAHWRPWYYGLCCHLLSWTRKHLMQWYWWLLQQHPPLPPKQSRRQPWKKNCDTKAEVKFCTADGSWQGDGKDSIIFKEHATGSLAKLWSTWEKQIVLSIFFLIFFFFWGGGTRVKGWTS